MNENKFSYERMSTRTRFKKAAKDKWEWPVGCKLLGLVEPPWLCTDFSVLDLLATL